MKKENSEKITMSDLLQKICNDIKKMTPQEFKNSLINAGILEEDGRLLALYRQGQDKSDEPAAATPSDDAADGGVIALRVPRKTLSTKHFDIRSTELPKRRPQNYTGLDCVPDDDE